MPSLSGSAIIQLALADPGVPFGGGRLRQLADPLELQLAPDYSCQTELGGIPSCRGPWVWFPAIFRKTAARNIIFVHFRAIVYAALVIRGELAIYLVYLFIDMTRNTNSFHGTCCLLNIHLTVRRHKVNPWKLEEWNSATQTGYS